MTEEKPFSRVVRVAAIPREGQAIAIEAAPAERGELASFYRLPAIAALTATLRVEPWGRAGRALPAPSTGRSRKPVSFRLTHFQ